MNEETTTAPFAHRSIAADSRSASISSDDYGFNLGSYHRGVDTKNIHCQRWFNRGLIWSYAFNHEEAAACFGHAIDCDPQCAMAHWGLAYTLGPNYNRNWEEISCDDGGITASRIYAAMSKARALASERSALEQGLICALEARYPMANMETPGTGVSEDKYADRLTELYVRAPYDLDVATLYAEALMNLNRWQLWNVRTGKPNPGARTLEAKQILERALTQDGAQEHPGLLHMYIHMVEMSSTPELALPTANNLRGLVPDSGHLNHMPSHLDVLCGDYQSTIESNSDAITADDKFFSQRTTADFYVLYRVHNLHFKIYAAMFSAQFRVAMGTVRRLEEAFSEEVLRTNGMADRLEGFLGMRAHVLIRFGRWHDILDLELPKDENLYCVTTATILYAKSVAKANMMRHIEVVSARAEFQRALMNVSHSRTLFNNKCIDILHIAEAMLDGELEYSGKNYDGAFMNLGKAINLYDNLPYDEPWGWMQPTRHVLGALLLQQGDCDHLSYIEEAAQIYRADLGLDDTIPRCLRHPNNVWALHGYHECLVRMGRTEEAFTIGVQLAKALMVADVKITSSCYCRRRVHEVEDMSREKSRVGTENNHEI